MKKIGIMKEIDGQGRLVIPKDMRDRIGAEKTVELVLTDEGILVKSPEYKLVKIERNEQG